MMKGGRGRRAVKERERWKREEREGEEEREGGGGRGERRERGERGERPMSPLVNEMYVWSRWGPGLLNNSKRGKKMREQTQTSLYKRCPAVVRRSALVIRVHSISPKDFPRA